MKLQNYQQASLKIREKFLEQKHENPAAFSARLNLSWSIWMFGSEPVRDSLQRLQSAGLRYVELKGNLPEGFDALQEALRETTLQVSGICGLFSPERDLSSLDPEKRNAAVHYIRQQLAHGKKLGARYLIVVPGAVGRTMPADDQELERSAATLKPCAGDFAQASIAAAIEPIRSAEVSLVHTVGKALEYIRHVGEKAIDGINGDIYHMLNGERHIGEAILKCGQHLVNLHIADSNRDAPGKGMIDIDTVIMAAYLVGMNRQDRFVTFEPLGPVPDPYVLSTQPCNVEVMDRLVHDSVTYFREREEIVRHLEN